MNNLEKSSMGFKLPDGNVFLLHSDDVKKISDEFWVQMIMNKQTHVYLLKDAGLKRAQELYHVFKAEKEEMNDKLKQKCLETIVKYLSENDFELTTLEELIKNNK